MEKTACIIIAMLMTMTAVAILGANAEKESYKPMRIMEKTVAKD